MTLIDSTLTLNKCEYKEKEQREDVSCAGFQIAHEPTALSTDYLKGTGENVKLIEIITGLDYYLID